MPDTPKPESPDDVLTRGPWAVDTTPPWLAWGLVAAGLIWITSLAMLIWWL